MFNKATFLTQSSISAGFSGPVLPNVPPTQGKERPEQRLVIEPSGRRVHSKFAYAVLSFSTVLDQQSSLNQSKMKCRVIWPQ